MTEEHANLPEPTDAGGFCQRAVHWFNEGHLDSALADLNEAVRLDPRLAKAYVYRGITLYQKGKHDAAIAEFTEAIRLTPENAWPYLWRGSALLEQGKIDQALTDYNEAIRLEPNEADGYINRGVALHDAGNYELAIADYNEGIRLAPNDARPYRCRGSAYSRLKRCDDALTDLNEAIRLAPDNFHGFEGRGEVFLARGELEAAWADYSDAIRLSPGNASLYVYRGVVHHTDRDFDAAITDYSEAIRLDPQCAKAYRCRGQAHYELDEYEDALADLWEAARLDPSNSTTFSLQSNVLKEQDDLDAAITAASEAIRLDPQDARAYRCRADAWREQEEFRKAVADYTEAIRLAPDASVYRRRGSAWESLGEDDKADADFDTALQLRSEEENMIGSKNLIYPLLTSHFAPVLLDDLTVTERRFPWRVRADLQRAVDGLVEDKIVLHFCGVRKQYAHEGVNFTDLLVRDRNDPPMSVPPQYEEIDIGDEEPIRCLKSGLWLLDDGGTRFAVFLEPSSPYSCRTGVRFQVATVNDEAGTGISQRFFRHLEEEVRQARSYRGKVLSLEWEENYSGASTGIKVHKLHRVERDQVILPRQTLELLDRNVIQFVRQRPNLALAGMATKKGLLFYGPPGTGKTHTLHYLAAALQGTTTLLISAEQVGLLGDYMTLARLLQPSMVVIEDADLIARERTTMGSACEEVLLNKLLNEMDGLKEDADILFILTTNRPEALERALSSRPGRIDQAIEFPFPDEEGREKLVRLYARGAPVASDVVQATVRKTENVSAAFIKELMRRAMQFQLERNGSTGIAVEDVDNALEELLFKGGSLNRKLLGGQIEAPVHNQE